MPVLKDIVIIFALSTLVNFLFTRIKIPTLIGYLLTGIVAGPHFLKIFAAPHQIELMAEIGVVLLLFTIGMEFSLKHLLKIRRIVFLGGVLQMVLTTIIIAFISRFYNLSWSSTVFVGILTALSSTAVVLKFLQDRSELTSNYGRTVLGILIFQDLILVPLLLFVPVLGDGSMVNPGELYVLLLKTLFIVGLVYAGNKWLIPKLLHAIALTKNQELFLMSILLICLSVALLTSQLGMTLAFGAFLAGLMISESEYSHNAFGNLIPFKDTFTSFFFVSIGMLLDLNFVYDNILLVLITVILVLTIKTLVAGGTAFVLGHTFRGTVLVGLALCQVGEFSFILAKEGIKYHIINDFYYQLFLSVAIITMSVSPLIMMVSRPLANLALKFPLPKFMVEGLFPLKQIEVPVLKDHIVFIGKDSRALSLSIMAKYMNIPYISIVFDPETVRKRQAKGETVIYGDAVNEPILKLAQIDKAEIVVLSIGNLITAMAVIEKIRAMNSYAYLLVRTRQVTDLDKLYKMGASQVIPEEFETAIELFERILKIKLVPQREINSVISKIRDDHYGIFLEKETQADLKTLQDLPNIEIVVYKLDTGSPVIGKSLMVTQLRRKYGVTLIAVLRNGKLIENPEPDLIFMKEDNLYLMGKSEQIANAVALFSGKEE
ncbi:MAG: cation:proton antiporter [Bacteroidales bacterium]|nr:cation:proton antiporter [Bacteroidales bacterium]